MTRLVFLHGLDSTPFGLKAQALRARYPHLEAPELPRDPQARHRLLCASLTGPALVVGSSLGGLSALMLARDVPERLTGMVLLAPAVGFTDAQYRTPELLALTAGLTLPPELPTTLLAGRRDSVIPIAAVRALAARAPAPERVRLLEFDADHRLNDPAAHAAMLEAVALHLEHGKALSFV